MLLRQETKHLVVAIVTERDSNLTDCVYLGDQTGQQAANGRAVFGCRIHEKCTTSGKPEQIASCTACGDRLLPGGRKFAELYRDGLRIADRRGAATDALRDTLAGGPAFLVCGGPSAKTLPLERLAERGPWSLAVNNAAGFGALSPNAFVCSDPPSKFCDGIWMDPNVMKFIPTPKMNKKRGRLRRKLSESHMVPCGKKCAKGGHDKCGGTKLWEEWFEPLMIDGKRMSARHAPNVWVFERRSWMSPDDSFFLEQSAAWGNNDAGVERTGEEKTVCTMLIGMRILYYLGARTIYLVGIDFQMNPSAGLTDNYSFGEDRTPKNCQDNNGQFVVVNDWLCRMADGGVFERFGVEIFNCNPNSGLRAFPHVPFDVAIMHSKENLPQEPFDLKGWYAKNE